MHKRQAMHMSHSYYRMCTNLPNSNLLLSVLTHFNYMYDDMLILLCLQVDSYRPLKQTHLLNK